MFNHAADHVARLFQRGGDRFLIGTRIERGRDSFLDRVAIEDQQAAAGDQEKRDNE